MMYARFGGDHKVERPLRLLRRAGAYAGDLIGPAAGAMAATVASTAAKLASPLVIKVGIDQGVIAKDLGVVTTTSLILIAVLVVQYITQRVSVYSVAWVAERYLRPFCQPGRLPGVVP